MGFRVLGSWGVYDVRTTEDFDSPSSEAAVRNSDMAQSWAFAPFALHALCFVVRCAGNEMDGTYASGSSVFCTERKIAMLSLEGAEQHHARPIDIQRRGSPCLSNGLVQNISFLYNHRI